MEDRDKGLCQTTNVLHPVNRFCKMTAVIFFIYPVFTLYKLIKKNFSGVRLSAEQILSHECI